MSTSLNLQQPLVLDEAEHAVQRRSFIKRAGTSLLALGSLMIAGAGPAAQTRPAPPARSMPQSAAGRPPADADNFIKAPG
jgi:hypothetical protein